MRRRWALLEPHGAAHGAVLHRWVAHGPLVPSIYRSQTGSHHCIYSGNAFEQSAYRKDEASVSHTFVPAAVGLAR